MKPKPRAKVQHVRPVSMLRLLFWQLQVLTITIILNIGIQVYFDKVHISELAKVSTQIRTGISLCQEIGWSNCKKAHSVLKQRSSYYE